MFGVKKTVPILRVASCVFYLGVSLLLKLPANGQGQALPVAVSFEFTAPGIVNSFENAASRKRWSKR